MKWPSSSFHLISFQRKVQDALQSVERTLELERKPRLAGDVDHTYGAKYGLVNLTSNASIIAYMNCLERLGLDANTLKSIDKTKPTTLRFDGSSTWKILKEIEVDVPAERRWEENEETKGGFSSNKAKVMKAVSHVTEFHWEVNSVWSISVYSGTAVVDKKVIKSRDCKTHVITQSKDGFTGCTNLPPIELSLTWLLKQIDVTEFASNFKVDIEAEGTKTPRRNDAVQHAEEFASHLWHWCDGVLNSFINRTLKSIVQTHNPAIPKPRSHTVEQLLGVKDQYSLFNPILPLMEDDNSSSTEDAGGGDDEEKHHTIGLHSSSMDKDENKSLLTHKDMSKLLNQHIQTLDEAISGLTENWSSEESGCLLSSAEAILSLLTSHLIDLSDQYTATMNYVESMLETQLVDAIGKRLTPNDLDKFVKYHNARLLSPMPQPFSHAIRCPGHNPVGLIAIESDEGGEADCVHTHSREVLQSSLKVPLNAATILDLTGKQYLHGYMNHRFGPNSKRHQLVARARQFSSFIMIIGNMTNASTLDPKDAVIVQNKDEVIVSLLFDEMPTAKEFKDAVKSLSPEQQRFARAYRKMQLSSSIFGVCIVQIKPQLEALLGLPANALDKEMKLTQDLMELFVEYQVPSDMLSYSGSLENVATQDKVSNVEKNVKSVLDVINAEKGKQLKSEQAKTEMAIERMMQEEADFVCTAMQANIEFGARPAPQQRMAKAMCGARLKSAPEPRLLGSIGSSAQRRILSKTMLCSAPASDEMQNAGPNEDTDARRNSSSAVNRQALSISSDSGVDFTLIPQILDEAVERCAQSTALRSTTVKTGVWNRRRQENLLTDPKQIQLSPDDVKREKNKAFDLLDALSRSGSFPIAYSELHVVVAVTHCFDKDVMSTVVCDNVNPIEKLECSTLILASAVHGVPARELIGDADELQRLEGLLPLLLGTVENDDVDTEMIETLEA